jgi:hypothetical protein
MREALLGKLVLVLSRATLEELAAIYRFATRAPLPDRERDARICPQKRGRGDGSSEAGDASKPPYLFRWTGRDWEVVLGGGRAFHLPNVLGPRYVNYLLHEPNVPISAFDLEVAIQPEKGAARCRNSIQPESDARALREYAREMRRLQECRERAQAAANPEEVARLEGEIDAVEAALQGSSAADTGRRARDNVRKAVAVVLEQLRGGGPEERALVEHLEAHLSIGLECLYSQPDGRIWE